MNRSDNPRENPREPAGRDIRSLDLGMLRTFDALMRHQSVSRAAAELFLSQPAVSASLNRLRELFDDPLFSRTAHGMAPTARAVALAPQVAGVLGGIAGLLDSDASFDPGLSSRIFRIVGSDHASRVILPALTATLGQHRSRVRIVWETPGTASISERMRRGELDLGVLARIYPPTDMELQPLYEDHYVYVTRPGHPQVGQPVTLEAFCATPQVFLGYGTSALEDVIDENLMRLSLTRLTQVAVSSFAQIVDLLAASDHGAVIAHRVASSYGAALAIHTLPFELPVYRQFLCWDARSDGDAGVQWLKREVQRIVTASVV